LNGPLHGSEEVQEVAEVKEEGMRDS